MEYKGQKVEYLKNISQKEKKATLLLYGAIGFSPNGEQSINGHVFASNLVYMSEVMKNIQIDINCVGGSINEGSSIINAMNTARMNGASISTNIVGVADSMGGMISAFGDRGKRTAANFSSGVVHLPMAQKADGKMVKIDEMPEGDMKKEALAMRDMLVTLMATSTGKTEAIVKKQMEKGERLNAQRLKDFGMIDNIVKLSNKPIELNNKTAVELMVACSHIKTNNPKKMTLVNKKLGLVDEAAETSAINAIQELQNKAEKSDQYKTDLEAKTEEVQTLKNKVNELETEAEAAKNEAAETYIGELVNSGKFKEENKESLTEQYKKDPEGFKIFVDSMSVENTFVDVTKEMNGAGAEGKKNKSEKLAKEYANLYKNNPDELKNIETKSPEKYQKMENAYLNSNIDIYSE